ncbi:Rieske 2Fe-2S domain-containing protein [Sphaerimonospora thailandensis]|uniref:Putative Rieske 2Fe-2S iron-sulfur protein n=1 Tax=Sphaerimonospora thailandensis TaxID=795644 RepID=A0A8J3W1Y8_9ACTN|nr:Rieske 2Fe-2S domain-containing protein [Sphaerimonospora thailandensis]GIH73262.1 putative Rieske 2Fe-2S iron-sulfur protein [Sphaerimonospora thailandensis]
MATLTSIGHAGLFIETSTFTLVFDPWMSPYGAYMGSWFQFPRNDHLDIKSLTSATYVAISHEHLDHMDSWFLEQLSDETTVLIPAYPSDTFANRIRESGVDRIIKINSWEPFPLDNGGSWIMTIPQLSPMFHDSGFLIVTEGRSVLNCNDAKLTASQARRAKHLAGGRLDVMAVQASSSAWHPMCYSYPAEEERRIAMEKRMIKLRAVHRLVRATEPELALPFAGPPCYLDPELRDLNRVLDTEHGAFVHPEAARNWLSEHLPGQAWETLKPGDRLDLRTGEITRDPVSAEFSFTEGVEEYIRRYAEDRAEVLEKIRVEYPEPGPGFPERFVNHFTRLGTLSDYFLEHIDMTVRFEITGPNGGVWDVRMNADGLAIGPATTERPGYTITVRGRWVEPILAGDLAWEDLLLSFRIRLGRDPDVYNGYLVGLLKHANAPALEAVEEYETGRDETERITVTDGDRAFEIARYCPHAGEDLSISAVIEDGKIHCLSHNFAFDLATGACVNARCAPLATREISPS